MKRLHPSLTPEFLFDCLFAILTVAATTVPLVLIGRTILGEAVIALLYLIPVGWSARVGGRRPASARLWQQPLPLTSSLSPHSTRLRLETWRGGWSW